MMALCTCVQVLSRLWKRRGGGQSANDGMPVRHCTGGPSDEELAREVLTHARVEHDVSDLTEERAREMVASHAQGTEDAS